MRNKKRLWLSLNAVRAQIVEDGLNLAKWTLTIGQEQLNSLPLLIIVLFCFGIYCPKCESAMLFVQTATGSVHMNEANIAVMDLGILTITSYRPIPAQTRPECQGIHSCFTSIGDIPTKYGIAVSPDLLASKQVRYGDAVYVDGYGWRIVNDVMAKKNHRAMDLMVWTHEEEHRVGVQHRRVWATRHE